MIRVQIVMEISHGRVRGIVSGRGEKHAFAGWLELLSQLMTLGDPPPPVP
jgi:hypothetical protein